MFLKGTRKPGRGYLWAYEPPTGPERPKTMDPNEALAQIRALVATYQQADRLTEAETDDLVEHVAALDGWLSNGGHRPSVWQRRAEPVPAAQPEVRSGPPTAWFIDCPFCHSGHGMPCTGVIDEIGDDRFAVHPERQQAADQAARFLQTLDGLTSEQRTAATEKWMKDNIG